MGVGGLKEAVVDGETGLLADSRQDLARNIHRLLADTELRESMGTAALERSTHFSWSRTAQQSIDVLREEIVAHQARERAGSTGRARR